MHPLNTILLLSAFVVALTSICFPLVGFAESLPQVRSHSIELSGVSEYLELDHLLLGGSSESLPEGGAAEPDKRVSIESAPSPSVRLNLRLINDGEFLQNWILDFQGQHTTHLLVSESTGTTSVRSLLSYSVSSHFYDRPIVNLFPAISLSFEPNQTRELMVEFDASLGTLPFRLVTPTKYHAVYQSVAYWNGLFYGAIVTIVILAMCALPFIGARFGLLYIAFVLAGALLVMSLDGSLFRYILPARQVAVLGLRSLLVPFYLSFGLIAMGTMLGGREEYPVVRRLVYLLSAVLVVGGVIAYFYATTVDIGEGRISRALLFFGIGAALVYSAYSWVKRRTGALPLTLGVCLGVIVLLFTDFSHPFSYVSVRGVVLIAATFFAMAMISTALAVRRERDTAIAAELVLEKEKNALSETLEKSRLDYERVKGIAGQRQRALSSVSHDIAQPLAALRSNLQQSGTGKPETNQTIVDAIDYLESLARTNIVDENDAETSSNDKTETFPVSVITNHVIRMFQQDAVDKGLTLKQRAPDPGFLVSTDPLKLMRLVSNLVSNAITHTTEGGVLIGCRSRGKGSTLTVWDTGPGMTSEEQERFFSAYSKGSGSPGSGLGLYIVRSISEELGLKLRVNSVPGKGTAITVLLGTVYCSSKKG